FTRYLSDHLPLRGCPLSEEDSALSSSDRGRAGEGDRGSVGTFFVQSTRRQVHEDYWRVRHCHTDRGTVRAGADLHKGCRTHPSGAVPDLSSRRDVCSDVANDLRGDEAMGKIDQGKDSDARDAAMAYRQERRRATV